MTPRTDAKERETRELAAPTHAHYGWKHARALERELAAANEAREKAERERDEAAKVLPCGHPSALLVRSVESDYTACELCDCRQRRDDAERVETELRAEVERLREDVERLEWYAANHTRVAYARRLHGSESGNWAWIDANGFAHDAPSFRAAIDAARKEA